MFKKFFRHMSWAFGITSAIFAFISDSILKKIFIIENIKINISDDFKGTIIKILLFIFIFLIIKTIVFIYKNFRKTVVIKKIGYSIHIEYGDLLSKCNGKRIINFDECFSTDIGEQAYEINKTSFCGQYIQKTNIKKHQICKLLRQYCIKASATNSLFQNKIRYESGTLLPNGDDLLLAFAKLNKDGLGCMSYDEFIECLNLLWKEIDKYYGGKDVYMPILGSGVTRMLDESLTQQKLLEIILKSYSLTRYKLKLPCKLHIVCKEREGFSLNEIEDY